SERLMRLFARAPNRWRGAERSRPRHVLRCGKRMRSTAKMGRRPVRRTDSGSDYAERRELLNDIALIFRRGERPPCRRLRCGSRRWAAEFQELSRELSRFLDEITRRVISEEVFGDTGEAEEVVEPKRLGQ